MVSAFIGANSIVCVELGLENGQPLTLMGREGRDGLGGEGTE